MENTDQNQDNLLENSSSASIAKIESKFTFWTGVTVALALFAAQIIAAIIAAIIAVLVLGVEELESANFMNIVMGASLIIAFPLAVWIILRKRSLELTAWNWNSKFWVLLPISFLMVFSVSYLTGTLMEMLPNYESMVAQYADMFAGMNKLMLVIGGGIIGPVCEEIIFRGVILKGLLKTYDYKKAILFSAIIFSVIHMVPLQMIATFFVGIILGYIYYKTRSLWLVCIIHIVNNMIAFLAGTENLAVEETTRVWINNDLLFFGSLALAMVLIFVMYSLFEKYYSTPDFDTSDLIA